jgi:hypothetical protein
MNSLTVYLPGGSGKGRSSSPSALYKIPGSPSITRPEDDGGRLKTVPLWAKIRLTRSGAGKNLRAGPPHMEPYSISVWCRRAGSKGTTLWSGR